MNISKYAQRSDLERDEDWGKHGSEAPTFNFPVEWGVKIIPPFAGALMRFTVTVGTAQVSIYYDPLCKLGCMNNPYWEIYPAIGGDAERFLNDQMDAMMDSIQASIDDQLGQA